MNLKSNGVVKVALCWLIGASAPMALAQQNQMPKDEAIERPAMPNGADVKAAMDQARAAMKGTTKEQMDKAAERSAASPIGAGKGPGGMPPAHSMPDVSSFMKGGGVDPAKLAEQYGAPPAQAMGDERVYKLVVFASLSMPEGSLLKLGRDVKKAGGVIVLRGMKHGIAGEDWARSVEAMKPLVQTGAEIQINPALFQLFEVRSVPTMIVSPTGVADKGCTEGRCAAGQFATVVGDVSLDYAMDKLVDRKDTVGRLARQIQEKLEGS